MIGDLIPKEKDPIIYKMPRGFFVGKDETTQKLYDLEEKRDRLIAKAAMELRRIMMEALGREVSFWGEALPEAFQSMLDGWDHTATTNAAIAYLQKRGFTVNEPDED